MTVIENEVEMDDVDEKISLAQLTREGDVEKIKIMLSKLESDGTSKVNELDESNVRNNFGTFYVIKSNIFQVSALHYAARQNSLHIMGLLLTQGAKVDIQAPGGLTPLHFAARYFDKLLMHPFMYIHVHMDLPFFFRQKPNFVISWNKNYILFS